MHTNNAVILRVRSESSNEKILHFVQDDGRMQATGRMKLCNPAGFVW
jgi:hypothetical protein